MPRPCAAGAGCDDPALAYSRTRWWRAKRDAFDLGMDQHVDESQRLIVGQFLLRLPGLQQGQRKTVAMAAAA